ncbi:MAG TPA: hypothetical protein VGK47_03695 [Nitrososphaeraceae archaeon]
MSKTRIAKLKGFDNLILGRDLSDIFKEGHIYAFREILGQIVVDDLGEYADTDQPHLSVHDYLITGLHLRLPSEEYSNK